MDHFEGQLKSLTQPYFEKATKEEQEEAQRSYYYYSSSSRSDYVSVYPEDDTTHTQNSDFYSGKKESPTPGGFVDEIHKKWWGDYDLLEDRHNYIQFLFPIREAGMASIQAMTKNEAEEFKKSKEMQDRLLKSYEMMLDFYGLTLNVKTGEVKRNEKNYKERYKHLNSSSHNYLRITRILKCLGICGLESFKYPLIKHYITEVFKNKELDQTTNSLIKYWLPTIREEKKLIELEEYIKELTGKRVSRRWYDKEERTWANVCIPLDSSKSYGEGKTFYNRDDNDDLKSNDLIDIDPPSRYVWRDTTFSDNSMTPTTPSRFFDDELFYGNYNDFSDEDDSDYDELEFSDEDIIEKIDE